MYIFEENQKNKQHVIEKSFTSSILISLSLEEEELGYQKGHPQDIKPRKLTQGLSLCGMIHPMSFEGLVKEDSEKEKNKIYQTNTPIEPPTIGSTTAQFPSGINTQQAYSRLTAQRRTRISSGDISILLK